jgi:transcription termination factor Rho
MTQSDSTHAAPARRRKSAPPPAAGGSEPVTGILKRPKNGPATLFDAVQPAGEVLVPAALIQQYGLIAGATVTGRVQEGRQGKALASVQAICGLAPEAYRSRPPFEQLVAVDPSDRFRLGAGGDPGMRALDLVAPIGRGTRGMIVAPPKAGKTMLLEQIARGIRTDQPDVRIVVLLIDERPEELTYFRRTVAAEVFASSSDQGATEHIALCELMLAHIRVELECGRHVVVLLDSLTRLVRAFNLRGGGAANRTLSGGLDAAAMQIPRRFFGLARNVENGGSVTLLATVLVDTNSRQDQLIFEEFKSTGNSEIVLDRALAQERIFPAIDVHESGTRKEELLYSPDEYRGLVILRRALARHQRKEALIGLFNLLGQYPTNEALLQGIQPAARASRPGGA